jgi:hypothetical protein
MNPAFARHFKGAFRPLIAELAETSPARNPAPQRFAEKFSAARKQAMHK